MSITRRLAFAALIVGGSLVAPGLALAHSPSLTPGSQCVDLGWEATLAISFGDPGPSITGTVTSTYSAHGSVSFDLAPGATKVVGADVVIPLSVASVTFTVNATWTADGVTDTRSATISRPEGCVESTTTTAATTTTTTPEETTTTAAPTTTAAGPTTTTTATTIAGALAITAITPICVRDAPFVQVTFGDQPQYDGRVATITFIDKNGTVVATHTATYVANGSVTFVYPGASVDANGVATDWPGWVFDGDEWVPDPTDSYLRDGLTVRVEVNPTATGQVAYPPATSACANPQQGVGGEQGVVARPGATAAPAAQASATAALPTTGRATGPTAAIAAAAVALGAAAMVLARRRPLPRQ